jgi:superfamily II DNA helicase RecQ
VIIDEAHCISLWGGSFRPDYAKLGLLRGRFPKHVPFIVASATLPDHILDNIRVKLRLSPNARMVRITNARPNVALSCRPMKHSEKSKADLRFLIPPGATKAEDIDITLVYCNQRIKCEDAVDSLRLWAKPLGIPESCIAFYHAKIGEKRKRELEGMLRRGEIRILVCTDAVGMVCILEMKSVTCLTSFEGLRYAEHQARYTVGTAAIILCTRTESWASWARLQYARRGYSHCAPKHHHKRRYRC